jgi:hypothetical protein
MRHAATEWPAVKDDHGARDGYFKNWSEALNRLTLGEAGLSLYRAALHRQNVMDEQ